MVSIVEIPGPLLAKCARRLKAEDLCNFRLSCKHFYNISLSKAISQDLVFNVTSISNEDVHNVLQVGGIPYRP